jgi:hypothetical protein
LARLANENTTMIDPNDNGLVLGNNLGISGDLGDFILEGEEDKEDPKTATPKDTTGGGKEPEGTKEGDDPEGDKNDPDEPITAELGDFIFDDEEPKVGGKTEHRGGDDYSSRLQILIEDGVIPEDAIQLEDEEGNPYDWKENGLDKETYQTVLDEYKKASSEGKVDIDDLDEEYLEFKKNGGLTVDYTRSRDELNKIEDLDLEEEKNQVALLAFYYRQKGLNDEEVKRQIKGLGEDEIRANAEQVHEKLLAGIKERHQQMLDAQKEQAKAQKEASKKFASEVKKKLKEYNYTDSKMRNVIDAFEKRDESGLSAIDKAFLDRRKNPEKAADLYEFLVDPDAFIARVKGEGIKEGGRATTIRVKTAKSQSVKSSQAFREKSKETSSGKRSTDAITGFL